jgi:hypothetical protein
VSCNALAVSLASYVRAAARLPRHGLASDKRRGAPENRPEQASHASERRRSLIASSDVAGRAARLDGLARRDAAADERIARRECFGFLAVITAREDDAAGPRNSPSRFSRRRALDPASGTTANQPCGLTDAPPYEPGSFVTGPASRGRGERRAAGRAAGTRARPCQAVGTGKVLPSRASNPAPPTPSRYNALRALRPEHAQPGRVRRCLAARRKRAPA